MCAAEGAPVVREVEIAARPETVWGFLVDADKATRWWGVTVELDPRVGGLLRVLVTSGRTAVGELVEIDPPRRLVCTWGWEPTSDPLVNQVPPGSSTVEFSLVPSPVGTLLRVVHSGLPNVEQEEAHAAGWLHYLGRLAVAAVGGDPGRDPWRGSD
jgi:uncharacterized protein YndB with AHSA1/START domain